MSRRALSVWLWLALLAACAAVAAGARYSADLSAFLPRAPDAAERVLVEQARSGPAARLILLAVDGADAPARAAVSRALAARLAGQPWVAAVDNGGGASAADRRVAWDARYLLAPTTAAQFEPAALHAAIAAGLDRLAAPFGETFQGLLQADPTGALLAALQAIEPAAAPPTNDGVWGDARRALLLLRIRASGTDTDAQAAALAGIDAAFAQARRDAGAPAVILQASGPAVFAVQARERIRRGVERVSLLGGALVLALLLAVYRSPRVVLLGLLPVLSGVLAGVAAVALGAGTVHGLTLGFGTTLIGEAVDYAIYYFVQGATGTLWSTVTLGLLTSLAGFSTLLPSAFPGLAQLGLFSIAGLVAAWLVARHVLPALRPATLAVRDLAPVGRRLLGALPRLRASRRWVLLLVLPALMLLTRPTLRLLDTRLAALSPVPAAQLALDAELRRALGASDGGDLVLAQGADADAALAAAEALAPRLQALAAAGAIGGFDSPARYLPSRAVQLQRLAALPDAATLRARLRQACAGLPIDAARFTPFVDAVQAARARGPMTRATLGDSSLGVAVDGMLLRDDDGRWLALLPLRAGAAGSLDTARVDAALAGSGARLVRLGALGDHIYAGYLHGVAVSVAAGLLAITLLIAWRLRAPLRVARVLAPLLAAVVVVAAGVCLQGHGLNLLHLVGLMLIVAIGSNYALFFDQGAQTGDIAPRTLASLLLANLATVLGFGPLALSGVPVLQALGETVAPGVLLALVFAAVLSAPQR